MWSCYLLVMPVQATVKKIVICVSLKAFFWSGFILAGMFSEHGECIKLLM